jgi:uncharacterized protein (DUF433 family)
MTEFDRITFDPEILDGQPIIRGTRLTVRRVLLILATYPDPEQRRLDYPQLDEEAIRQALQYAAV